MHASSPAEETNPAGSNKRLVVLVAVLLVAVAFWLYRNQGGSTFLPSTIGVFQQRLAAQPYAGDAALAAVYSDHIGREVSADTVAEIGPYIGNTMIRMYWLEIAGRQPGDGAITKDTLLSRLETYCPRAVQDNSDVVCYHTDEKSRIVVPGDLLARVRDTSCGWQWLNDFVSNLEPSEAVHFRELEEAAADEFAEFIAVFSVALFDAASRENSEKEGEGTELSSEVVLGTFEALLAWEAHSEDEQDEDAEGEAEPAENEDARAPTPRLGTTIAI